VRNKDENLFLRHFLLFCVEKLFDQSSNERKNRKISDFYFHKRLHIFSFEGLRICGEDFGGGNVETSCEIYSEAGVKIRESAEFVTE
jgi:hypothetical protein